MGVALDTSGVEVCTLTSTWDENKMARWGWRPKERRRDYLQDFQDSTADNTQTWGNPCTKQDLQWDSSQPSLQLLLPSSFLSPLQPPPVKEEEELPSQHSMVMMIHCLGEGSLVAHLFLLPPTTILAGKLQFGRGCQECSKPDLLYQEAKGFSSPYPSLHQECRRIHICASLLLVALLTLCQGAQGGRKSSRRKEIL